MKVLHLLNPLALSAALCALSACGGGGNESGPATELLASPSSVTVMGPSGSCYVGPGPKVFVYGGQPPYKLSNSAEAAMTLDQTRLQNSGDGFQITFINNICLTNIPVTVEDAMGRVLPVAVNNQLGV